MVFIGLLSLVSILLAVITVIDLREPVIWGTFEQEGCESKSALSRARQSCRPYGEWRSDDGSIVEERIYLDGFPDRDGSTRAGFRPTGINNDDDNDIVHVEVTTAIGPWFAIAFAGGVVVWWGWRVQMWRYSTSTRFRPRQTASPDP